VKRFPMRRSTTPMKRNKPMGKGKKATLREAAVRAAKAHYFGTSILSACQISGMEISQGFCVAHHLTPRAELRKKGVENLDAAFRLIILHPFVHVWLHGGRNQMGRPRAERAARIFGFIENRGMNAFNKERTELPADLADDLHKFLKRHK